MNKVILSGRLTKDIEVKTTSNQTAYTQFTVAVQRKFKDNNGNYLSDFVNCVAWRNTAEFISKYFSKGSKIAIVGSIQTRNFEGSDGKKVYITEVLVDEVEFVESKADNKPTETKPAAPIAPSMDLTSDLPFEI